MRRLLLVGLVALAAPAAAAAAPATPDPGFGTGGVVVTPFPARTATAAGMLLDQAGRPVVVVKTGAMEAGLLRRSAAGGPDAAPALAVLGAGTDSRLTELVEHGTGYVAGGWIEEPARRFALIRFTAAGAPDTDFGVVRDAPGEIGALAVDAQQRIVAAGRSGDRIAVARFAPDGMREALSTHDVPAVSGEDAGGVVVEPGGRIVVAGTGIAGGERRLVALALTVAGTPDPAFGAGGAVTLDVGDGGATVRAMARQPDGKLLVGGATGADGAFVVRLNADGTPDLTFSSDGIARVGVSGAELDGLAVQPNGKIVVAGTAGGDSLVARFRPGGARDPGFGNDGIVRVGLGTPGAPDGLSGVGVAADGGIVGGGLSGGAVALLGLTGGDTSDPAVTMTADAVGDLVTFTVSATNRGVDPAADVRIAVTPPPDLAAQALTRPGGAPCDGTSCALGTVPAGATVRVTLLARAKQPGPLPASATVTTATFDADAANNVASVTGMAARNRVVRRDRTKPAIRLRLGAKRLRASRRFLRLRLTTSEVASVRLTARAKGVKTLVRPRRVMLGRKGTHRVTLKLTKAGRKAVRRARQRERPRRRRLAIVAGAHATDRSGNGSWTTQRLILRR
jgi:uncharacterized delta-60 repeat protein/uncharacterized repeat protein (TIGR01451 family)